MTRDRSAASGAISASTPATSGPTGTGCRVRCSSPASIRPMARISSTRPTRWRLAVRIWPTDSQVSVSAAARSRSSSWANPRIAFSGVRSLWLIREGSLFFWSPAADRACRSRSRVASRRCTMPASRVLVACAASAGLGSRRPARVSWSATAAAWSGADRSTASTTTRAAIAATVGSTLHTTSNSRSASRVGAVPDTWASPSSPHRVIASPGPTARTNHSCASGSPVRSRRPIWCRACPTGGGRPANTAITSCSPAMAR